MRAGVCGAALFIAAHIHGFERTKREIISVVHVGWSTVEKRVMEFAQSDVGDLTVAEFEKKAKEIEDEKVRGFCCDFCEQQFTDRVW